MATFKKKLALFTIIIMNLQNKENAFYAINERLSDSIGIKSFSTQKKYKNAVWKQYKYIIPTQSSFTTNWNEDLIKRALHFSHEANRVHLFTLFMTGMETNFPQN